MGRHMARWLCVVVTIVPIAACTPEQPVIPSYAPVPVRSVIADAPPYLCYWIPKAAVPVLTGYTGAYEATPAKRDPDGYSCSASNDVESILVTRYDRSTGRDSIETWMRNGEEEGRARFPKDLGVGHLDNYKIAGRPFRSIGAWFRCGEKNSLITILLRKNPARDQDHDLVQLMRIAQRRFAEMFSCEPSGPPPSEKSR